MADDSNAINDVLSKAAAKCRIATPHDIVTNSECVYTFHSPYTSEKGIVVNLTTFVGTVDELAFNGFGDETSSLTDDSAALFVRICKARIQRVEKLIGNDVEMMETKATKLGMGIDGGFLSEQDKYETVSTYSIVLGNNAGGDGKLHILTELPYTDETKHSFPSFISQSADAIICHAGLAVMQDLTAWELEEEPKPVSKYLDTLPFVDNGVKISHNPSDWKCEFSGDTENLWLNLSDGFIGGGRKNWDGSGGSNGALNHFLETGEKYPLVVKLGTITEDLSTADCYSYAKDEDCPVQIPCLRELLEKRGIMISGMQKTVKSTAELEVELNATYAFDAITETGSHLIPVAGPGLQGLQNLGNSCYMNSVVQMLFSGTIPELSSRYGMVKGIGNHPLQNVSPTKASDDLLCQTTKLAYALSSGLFCGPIPNADAAKDTTTDPKYRLAPRMFKHVVGKDHADFRTGQQQDAAQYFQYLLEKLDRAELGAADRLQRRSSDTDTVPVSSHLFSFKTESRLVCETDNKIKYKQSPIDTVLSLRIPISESSVPDGDNMPDVKRLKADGACDDDKEKKIIPLVTFSACIEKWACATAIDDYRWPHLQNSLSRAMSQTRFVNFPRYLMVQMQRYELGDDWQPRKIEVDIDVPEQFSFQTFKALGPQEGETLVPDDDENGDEMVTDLPVIDEGALGMLMDMGFNMNGCKRALMAVGGSDVGAAMNWVFEHNEDPDFNDPLPECNATSTTVASELDVDESVVTSLVDNLGCFTLDQVRAALKHCGGAPDRAADWLFSHMDDLDKAIAEIDNSVVAMNSIPKSTLPLEDGEGKYDLVGIISHIGKNTGSGHYVAHLKKEGKWVIFNDEKVALSENPPIRHAYMYLFQRSDTLGSPNRAY